MVDKKHCAGTQGIPCPATQKPESSCDSCGPTEKLRSEPNGKGVKESTADKVGEDTEEVPTLNLWKF